MVEQESILARLFRQQAEAFQSGLEGRIGIAAAAGRAGATLLLWRADRTV